MEMKLTWLKEEDKKDQEEVIENAAKKLPYSKTKILAALSQSVLELQKKIDTLSVKDTTDGTETEVNSLKDKIKEHNDLIVEIKENINSLTESIEDLKNDLDDTTELDNLRSEITRLNGKNVALETKMENLRSSVNAQLTEMQNKWFKGEGTKPVEPSTEEPKPSTEEKPESSTDTNTIKLDTVSTSEPMTSVEDNKTATTANNSLDSLLTNLRNIRI